ncbi:hypothetical protein C2857_002953 [Epichloe festucae Fl1]|uniref:Thioesterase domain-containing protein n=1 Tax=Epichloe festucae (strain Fl1) TaxID=877507 RepID=A0A7U3SN68_EPIFF|nr:hypothetical protein C2857_002953 [Epichloe festucae Fl1]
MPDETPFTKGVPLNCVLSPPLNLHPPDAPLSLYESALQFFTSIPWCADLLLSESSPHGIGPAIPFIPHCLMPISHTQDQFVGATLATHPRALKHMLCFFRPQDATQLRDPKRPIQTVDTLFDLGDGLTGYRGILHGGMISTMVDEAMCMVNDINQVLGKDSLVYKLHNVTVGLEIKFLKPVPVPGVIRVTSWTEGIEGRKTRLRCEVKDGEGNVFAKASSMWVALDPKL